jgi:hypothetical protein
MSTEPEVLMVTGVFLLVQQKAYREEHFNSMGSGKRILLLKHHAVLVYENVLFGFQFKD